MLMRVERPIERRRWEIMLDKELLMLAAFVIIGAALAAGLAIVFPIPPIQRHNGSHNSRANPACGFGHS